MNLPPHIPHGAIEKTDYVFEITPFLKEIAPETRFFAFDGKCYSFKEVSLYNGMNWSDFCEEIRPK